MDPGKSDNDGSTLVVCSPGNSQYYIPLCEDVIKPVVGQLFSTLEEGVQYYHRYAHECGFDVRRGTDTKSSDDSKVIVWKYLLCSKQGYTRVRVLTPNSESLQKRRRNSNRCGCIAKIAFRYEGRDGYRVKIFEERHTHNMVHNSQKHFLKNNRKLTAYHQDFIMNCLKSNIGTSSAYKLFKNCVGSYSDVGATIIDFKNFKRDLNSYMIGCDGQMVIDSLFRKKERCEAFYFDYDVNEANQLSRLFCCDPIGHKSFCFFGDVVSADATYKSNRYDMVFVPFTGVDNNKSSITFAFGLLLNEDVGSYVWLFENFKKAMVHEPYVLLTDQDPDVKAAVEKVFSNVVHRFCMWHIMFKVPVKVKVHASESEEFRKRFNAIIWSNELKKHEFEEAWISIISEFNLESNNWLKTMFDLGHFWIPAFFQDISMGGLLRTTSRSESQNFFFSNFIGRTSSLVVFMLQYDNAIDSQRHTQRKLDLDSSTCFPSLKTPLQMEKQCASVYTLNVFYDVQDEIYASVFDCLLVDFMKDVDVHRYNIRCGSKIFVVQHIISSEDLICSCNKFLNVGIPCSHMFTVLRNIGMDMLPSRFFIARWTKKSTLKPMFEIDGSVFKQGLESDEKKVLVSELFSEMHSCINLIEDNSDNMNDLLGVLRHHKDLYIRSMQSGSSATTHSTQSRFEKFVGPIPERIDVLPPPQYKNKGRPRGTRIKGVVERIRENTSKETRLCTICNQPGHNSRTCKKVKTSA